MIIMRYDLRIPPAGSPAHGVTASGQYAACLEQVQWADRIGLDMVVLSEHHGTDDGFMPAQSLWLRPWQQQQNASASISRRLW
jgi:alkanesulfonate monooxygenase SsuD/methylene tetrahydromethanopterin reductase-like flavin-dependent oxidoreductase (luciferase family)